MTKNNLFPSNYTPNRKLSIDGLEKIEIDQKDGRITVNGSAGDKFYSLEPHKIDPKKAFFDEEYKEQYLNHQDEYKRLMNGELIVTSSSPHVKKQEDIYDHSTYIDALDIYEAHPGNEEAKKMEIKINKVYDPRTIKIRTNADQDLIEAKLASYQELDISSDDNDVYKLQGNGRVLISGSDPEHAIEVQYNHNTYHLNSGEYKLDDKDGRIKKYVKGMTGW